MNPLTWQNPEQLFVAQVLKKIFYNSVAELRLYLTFIGWGLLCILTLGIGLLWFVPYMQSALAHFYEDVKAEYEAAQAQGE